MVRKIAMHSVSVNHTFRWLYGKSINICGCYLCRTSVPQSSSRDTNNKLVLGVPEDWVAQLAEPERMKDLAVKVASCHGVIPFK